MSNAPADAGQLTGPGLGHMPELRLKKILAATDFSECSHKALQYAVSLGKHFNAEVDILHVFDAGPPQVGILECAMLDTRLQDDARNELEAWQREIGSEVHAEALFREGTPAHERIVAVARETGADLIIIGNHGRKALDRILMGSTAEKVVRHAPCPVLVIREREHDFLANAPAVTV